MNKWNDIAMNRTLQTDESTKLLNIFEGGIHMSKAMNPVPIYHKITLTIDEASELSNSGINRIDAMLRKPNCPFVLFVGKKKLVKRKEYEEFISKSLYI